MSTPTPLHLVLGDEEFLVERAVSAVIAEVRAASTMPDELPIDRLRAGDADAAELANLLSPSLFAEDRVVVLEAAADAGKDAVALVQTAAADPPPGIVLIVLHSGGGRTPAAKALPGALKELGAQTHECGKLKAHERGDFVRGEFRAAKVRVSGEVVQAVLDGVGSDLRELAAACSQLVADTGGKIDVAAVRRYYAGRAEVTGFEIAELTVDGDRRAAIEALRWALDRGTPVVLVADALADTVHTIARVGSAGRGDPFRLAPTLGMPPWKVKKAQAQARGWDSASIGAAMRVVTALNADVKGGAVSAEYALERAVAAVMELRPSR